MVTAAIGSRGDLDASVGNQNRAAIVASLLDAWCSGATWSPERLTTRQYPLRSPGGPVFAATGHANGRFSDDSRPTAEAAADGGPPPRGQITANEVREALLRYEKLLDPTEVRTAPERSNIRPLTVSWSGARMRDVDIVGGPLDLRYLNLSISIHFIKCRFAWPILLSGAQIGALRLSGSTFPWLSAVSAEFKGLVNLDDVRCLGLDFERCRFAGRFAARDARLLSDLLRQIEWFLSRRDMWPDDLFASLPELEHEDAPLARWLALDADKIKALKQLIEDSTSNSPQSPRTPWKRLADIVAEFAQASGELLFGRIDAPDRRPSYSGWSDATKSLLSDALLALGLEAPPAPHPPEALRHDCSDILNELSQKGTHDLGNPPQCALSLDGAVVNGEVNLLGIHTVGEIDMRSSEIAGDLVLVGARIENPGRAALDASAAQIKGGAFLGPPLAVWGSVYLYGTIIGGDLDLGTVVFRFPAPAEWDENERISLRAETGHFKQRVFLQDVRSVGSVKFTGAEIAGAFVLRGNSHIDGLNLYGARAKSLAASPRAIKKGTLVIDGFTYERLGQSDMTQRDGVELLKRQSRDDLGENLKPQPFLQLAQVLATTGHNGEARKVLRDLSSRKLIGDIPRYLLGPVAWILFPMFFAIELFSVIKAYRTLWRDDASPHKPGLVWIVGETMRRLRTMAIFPLFGPLYLGLRFLLWMTVGHGFSPGNAVPYLVATWIFGSIVFGAAYDRGLIVPVRGSGVESPVGATAAPINYRPTPFDGYIYSLDLMVPLIDLAERRDFVAVSSDERPASASPLRPVRLRLLDALEKYAAELSSRARDAARRPHEASLVRAADYRLSLLATDTGAGLRWVHNLADRHVGLLDRGFAKWWMWIQIGLGWIFSTFVVGSYTGLIRPPETRL